MRFRRQIAKRCARIQPFFLLTLTLSSQGRGDKIRSMPRLIHLGVLALLVISGSAQAAPPAPPKSIMAEDHPLDEGEEIDVTFELSPEDVPNAEPKTVERYELQRSAEPNGKFEELAPAVPDEKAYKAGQITVPVGKNHRGEPYYFRVRAVNSEGEKSAWVTTSEPAIATREWFLGKRMGLAIMTVLVCGSVITFIAIARTGRDLRIRKIAGLEAVDEAVGRATEMGRTCLFVPGVQDINDIQTVAGLTVLSRVAQTAAEYDAVVEVPTSRCLS